MVGNLPRLFQTLWDFQVLPGSDFLSRFWPPVPPVSVPQRPICVSDANAMLFDFRQGSGPSAGAIGAPSLWRSLDDVVMGGVSQSQWQELAGVARFGGIVSTENSGGFASVRTVNLEPALDLAGYQGLELCLRGDGQRYKFLLRDRSGWDSVAYAYAFDTLHLAQEGEAVGPDLSDPTVPNPVPIDLASSAGQWQRVRIPFAQMVPVLRARTLSQYGPIQLMTVRSLQLMLSKFEYDGQLNPSFRPGNFQLDLAWIRTYSG
jgi:hypothetical protein